MPEALTLCNTYCISLPNASVYLLHHELKSWYEMSSTYSTWMKAAIMAARLKHLRKILRNTTTFHTGSSHKFLMMS